MRRIDAHAHFIGDRPRSQELLERWDMKMLNVCVAKDAGGLWRMDAEAYRDLARKFPDRYAWCTAFDPPAGDDPNYSQRVIEDLKKDFQAGAVGCKVWKNIGMQIRKPSGEYLTIDDPLFEPIFLYLEQAGRTVLIHTADPISFWEPMEITGGYLKNHPEWYMYGKAGAPPHEQLMSARDRVVERHPELRVVAAHLGSMEHDLSAVVERLEKYPNLAIGIGGRTSCLAAMDPGRVRRFVMKYQDRLLFGTDLGPSKAHSKLSEAEYEGFYGYATSRCNSAFEYYESDGPVAFLGREVQGLHLAPQVLAKLYRTNAESWYPGL